MTQNINILLFGDQTVDILPSLIQLYSLSKTSSSLSGFLQLCTDTLQIEFAKIAPADRPRCSFRTLLDLCNLQPSNGAQGAILSTSLLCASQLGRLLVIAETDPSILSGPTDRILLGLCTGMLPAIAAASVTSISELFRVAPELLSMSLRLGVEASSRSRSLEQSTEPWATIVSGIKLDQAQNALKNFYQTRQMPLHKQAYISAVSASSLTISGPPSSVSHLLSQCSEFAQLRKSPLPISAAYHAFHLESPSFDTIAGNCQILDRNISSNTLFLSTSSGKLMDDCQTVRQLFHRALDDIFRLRLDWSAIVENVTSLAADKTVQLVPIGPCHNIKSLQKALQNNTVFNDSRESELSSQGPRAGSGDIAIIGMASRMPGSETLEEFWSVLENGRDLHKEVPQDRFDVKTHCDPTGKVKNTTLTPFGCFIDHPDLFDARFFNMSPREAAQTDPIQRLLLITAYEALEMAGYANNRTPATDNTRVSSFMGQTSDDWREVNASQDIENFYITGGIRAFGPGRLNYHFGWEGASYSLDTACSSSSAAIQLACSALRARECDTSLAGGANVMTASGIFAGLSRGGFLSPTGSCKTYDEGADGYCRADGVGIVVLKRLEDAILDRDNIQAVIKGVATNHSAEAISITHPHAETQQRLFKRSLQDACLSHESIDYVEMHGTGTQAGDTIESTSVAKIFSPGRTLDNPLYFGTVKPNIGHGEAASGVTSVIKAAMMFSKNTIPPHIGIKRRINPKLLDFNVIGMKLADTKTSFRPNPRGDGKRRIMVNNFDATGGNTSIILEDPPKLGTVGTDPRGSYTITVSAKTRNALQGNIHRLIEFLKANPRTELSYLSYTTTARRMHHSFRKYYVASNVPDLRASLEHDLEAQQEKFIKPKSVVFVFTGQASQYTAMGIQLYKTSRLFRSQLAALDTTCTNLKLPSFIELLTNPDVDINTCDAVRSQLALAALEVSLANLWCSWGIKPDLVIGHSIGEYAAMCTAGILSITDMLYLVGTRAHLMQRHCTAGTHAMLAVKLSAVAVQQILNDIKVESCEVSCLNGPESTVASGKIDDVQTLSTYLKASSTQSTILKTPYAFHSAQMDPFLEDYKLIGRGINFSKPNIPFVSTLLGTVATDENLSADYIVQHARNPVQFLGAIQDGQNQGLINEKSVFIEIGPNPSCLAMIRSIVAISADHLLPSLSQREDNWLTLSKSLGLAYENGLDVNWNELHREYEESLLLLELPSYAFDLKSYWIQYQGDWAIHHGSGPQAIEPALPPFSTTTLQKIESEDLTPEHMSVTFASNLAEPNLRAAIMGHLVNDTGLCPSSVYGDMAFTAASYIWSRMEPGTAAPAMDVRHMEVPKPLILKPESSSQIARVTAKRDKGSNTVKVTYASQDGDGEIQEHAQCFVDYGDGEEWMSQWAKQAYLVQSRIDSLSHAADSGKAHRLLKGIVYKLFANLVDYAPRYQGMQEVCMDSDSFEAAAKVKFQSGEEDGIFTFSPYWIDSIAHLSGFILNGLSDEDTVYISHGWESLRIATSFSRDKNYTTHVRMQPTASKGVMAGDVFVFEDSKVVGVCTGLKFQALKKSILHRLLPGKKAAPVVSQLQRAERPTVKTDLSVLPKQDMLVPQVLQCVCTELGIDLSEMTDETDFADLGVDSISSISIVEMLRKETGVEFPSSILATHPTVRDLKSYCRTRSPAEESDSSSESECPYASDSELSPASTTISTPAEPEDPANILKAIIVTETGVESNEIQANTDLADVGVDSILSLSILGDFKTQCGQALPSSFFHDHATFASIQAYFGSSTTKTAAQKSLSKHVILPNLSITTSRESLVPSSKAIHLQGPPPSPSTPTLFLLPDGSGSASSYTNLPLFSPSTTVLALNSPFLSKPEAFALSIPALAEVYLREIRAKQPHGPYFLGGWSIGGTYALEIARQLIAAGEFVEGLLLIDAPCPGVVPPLEDATIDLLEKIGTFDGIGGKKGIPEGVRTHFRGSVKALREYDAGPLPKGKEPKCLAIWAGQGVWETVGEDVRRRFEGEKGNENGAQEWMMEPRKKFGGNGWERLVGRVETKVVEGNHFSIMRQPQIKALGSVMAAAVADFARR